MRIEILAVAAVLAMGVSQPAESQERHQVTLEGSVFRGTAGYAHAVARGVFVGGELGFGFPQLDRTFTPTEDRGFGAPDFREYAHVAVFVRQRVRRVLSYDAGVRASLVDLLPCTASDCWPAGFVGGYIQPMIGGRRWSVGPRLVAGWAAEPERGGEKTFALALAPLNIRFTLGL